MPIVFLDSRVSTALASSTGTTALTTAPFLLGDIGLQVNEVLGTPNEGDVRVELMGSVNLTGTPANQVTITIERNGTGTPGTGTVIYTAVVDFGATGNNLIGFSAADFHPPVPTTGANIGQLRYTMFVADTSTAAAPITIVGPVNFNGLAQAGQ
ncbi:hypothetical protein ACE6ED_00075 [Paenibacillus sp. CN-4]|uniref:hypothetical protein n=1 Tax=Paenibacillus nanchangensis TaxID=3348343 RepID=UPI0039791FBE